MPLERMLVSKQPLRSSRTFLIVHISGILVPKMIKNGLDSPLRIDGCFEAQIRSAESLDIKSMLFAPPKKRDSSCGQAHTKSE